MLPRTLQGITLTQLIVPYRISFTTPCTPLDIESRVSKLKNLKASDTDNIPIMLIEQNILYSLWELTNIPLPDALKLAKVIPLHKDDDTQNADSYRLISNLLVISKVFETVTKKIANLFKQIDSFECSPTWF